MSELFFKATTPDNRSVVEVQYLEDGSFHCTVVLDGKHTLDEFKTKDSYSMWNWTQKQMLEVMRRCTDPKPTMDELLDLPVVTRLLS